MMMHLKRFACVAVGLAVLSAGDAFGQASTPPEPAPVEPPKSAAQLLEEGQAKALRVILDASRSDDPLQRANALEAIQPRPKRALPMSQIGLEDTNPAVRFNALVNIGELKLMPLRKAAERLLKDEDPSVRAAAMYAVSATGGQVNMNELPGLLTHKQAGVRANAVMMLGLMGDASAVPMMREMAQLPMPRASAVRKSLLSLQYAEALVELGEEGELAPIRAAMYSQEYELRVIAVQMLGRLGDHSMKRAMQTFLDDEPLELKLAAAQALARLGDESGKPAAIEASLLDAAGVKAMAEEHLRKHRKSPFRDVYRALLANPQQQAQVAAGARGQSAFALAEMGGADAAGALVKLLDDENPVVRLSSAAGVLIAQD